MSLFSEDLPHVLVYGGSEFERRLKVKSILNQLYGNDEVKTRYLTLDYGNNCMSSEFMVLSNAYFMEFVADFSMHFVDQVKAIFGVLFSRKQEEDVPFKVLVIYEAHKLDWFEQTYLTILMRNEINKKLRIIVCSECKLDVVEALEELCSLITLNSNDSDSQQNPFDKLPDELLYHIFGRLNSFNDWLKCKLVCRRWKQTMDNLLLKKESLDLEKAAQNDRRISLEKVLAILKRCPNIKHLVVSDHKFTDYIMSSIGTYFPHLETLEGRSMHFSKTSLHSLSRKCPNLKYIEIDGQSSSLDDEALKTLLETNKNLKGITFINTHCINMGCLNYVQNLQLLASDKFTNTHFALLNNNPNYHSIRRLDVTLVDGFDCKLLLSLPNLTHLAIKWKVVNGVPEETISALGKLKNLKEIALDLIKLDDELIVQICSNNRYLERLSIQGANCILTDESVSFIPFYCPLLVSMYIRNCTKLTVKSFTAISTLKKLKYLHLKESNASNEDVINFMEKIPDLALLDFTLSFRITVKIVEKALELVKERKLNPNIVVCYQKKMCTISDLVDKFERLKRYQAECNNNVNFLLKRWMPCKFLESSFSLSSSKFIMNLNPST